MSSSTAWREVEEEKSSSRGMYPGKKSAYTVVRLRKEKVDETCYSGEDSASHRDAHRPRHPRTTAGICGAAARPCPADRFSLFQLPSCGGGAQPLFCLGSARASRNR